MKKMTYLLFVVLLAAILHADGTFKLDFDGNLWGTAGVTEDGYESYVCSHENESTFTAQSYTAFGTTVTVEPSWADGAPAAAMQAINRAAMAEYPYEFTGDEIDLIAEWIGTDTRETSSEPLTLTISGLPAGRYSWLSYHNDLESQTGVFSVTVTDTSGTSTSTGYEITADATTLEEVGQCELQFSSNGTTPVKLAFALSSGTFFVMNGFELTLEALRGVATNPVPEAGDTMVDSETVAAVSWTAPTDPNFVSVDGFDVYFGVDPNVVANSMTYVTDESMSVALDYGTMYYWRVDPHVVWDSNGITGLYEDVVVGQIWTFTTLAQDMIPIVMAGGDVLTSLELLPASLTGIVDDSGDGDIVSVIWEIISENAADAAVTDTTTDLLSPTATLTTEVAGEYTVQLSATDGASQTGSDTLVVTVAEDTCAAAQLSSTWSGFNAYDLSEDCVVNLGDFAIVASEWLDDRNLTGQE